MILIIMNSICGLINLPFQGEETPHRDTPRRCLGINKLGFQPEIGQDLLIKTTYLGLTASWPSGWRGSTVKHTQGVALALTNLGFQFKTKLDFIQA